MNDTKLRFDVIRNIMHMDLITMNGGKNNLRTMAILVFVVFGGLGMIVNLMGLYIPILSGGLLVGMLFHNESKYHSDKLNCLLPFSRKELVTARFVLTTGLYIAVGGLFYLLMLVSIKLDFTGRLMPPEADLLSLFAERTDGVMTKLGVFNLMYLSAFSVGLIANGSQLKKYFKSSENFAAALGLSMKNSKLEKRDLGYALILVGFAVLWALTASEIIPIAPVISLIMQVLAQLVMAANGLMLSAVVLTWGCFSTAYSYICSTLEYEDREL